MIFLYSIAEIRIFVTNTTSIFDMKHNLLLFSMLFLVMPLTMKAIPVDEGTAREVGFKFMNANAKTPMRGINDLQLVTTYSISRGDAAFYIFNTPNGFVIVSADDCATPILGYSDKGQFDMENIPIQMQDYLQDFVEQIQYGIENHLETDEATARQWELVRSIGHIIEQRAITAVAPLLTDTWDQGCYYNAKCPEDSNGPCGHVVTGCAATSFAQIMRYWGYPTNGMGSHTYTPPGYPEQTVNFTATTYDWAHMPNSLSSSSSTTEINAVATLMWHCGVAINMRYDVGGSGAVPDAIPWALRNYFGYSNELSLIYKSNYSDDDWLALMKTCLDVGRPIYYGGWDANNGYGHGFVCDGYDANNLLHFNWGWSGYHNGYYSINAMNPGNNAFTVDNMAIINIHPNCTIGTTYLITVSTDPSNSGTISGMGSYNCGEVCTLTATDNEDYSFMYWTEDGEQVSSEATYSFRVINDRNLVAHYISEESIVFADANVKSICVSHWDNNGDGELSYAEAASVEYLSDYFQNNTEITSFEELQYFINLTTIDDYAFSGCSGFTGSLTIPNFVTTIGDYAFKNCSGFTGNLTIPNSVTRINNSAFYNCSGFTGNLTISNSVTSIGNSAFYNCSGFTGNLTIPNSVTTIGDSAFKNCSGFTGNLIIPNSITWIGYDAFYNCSGFTGNLTIPNSITAISSGTFYRCSGFTGSLTIPNSVTSIGWSAFCDCSGFTGNLTIPNSVTTIGYSAFYGCNGFTGNLTIPNSVTTIGNQAFCNCSGLTGDLVIPNSVTTIGNRAFYGCSGFTGDLTIPSSVTSIGSYAFNNCRTLSSVIMLSSTVPSLGNGAFSGSNANYYIYVPYPSLDAYKTAAIWSNYEPRILPMAYAIVSGYGNSNDKWVFIASPLSDDVVPTAIDNMLLGTNYDLYQFDQSATDEEWQNYKVDSFNLVNGQGYVYAKEAEVNIIFKGAFNEDETKVVSLDYDAEKANPGWNLVGNPFPVEAYIDRPYYVMNEDGTAINPIAVPASTPIPPCVGVLVKADGTGESVTFSRSAPDTQK